MKKIKKKKVIKEETLADTIKRLGTSAAGSARTYGTAALNAASKYGGQALTKAGEYGGKAVDSAATFAKSNPMATDAIAGGVIGGAGGATAAMGGYLMQRRKLMSALQACKSPQCIKQINLELANLKASSLGKGIAYSGLGAAAGATALGMSTSKQMLSLLPKDKEATPAPPAAVPFTGPATQAMNAIQLGTALAKNQPAPAATPTPAVVKPGTGADLRGIINSRIANPLQLDGVETGHEYIPGPTKYPNMRVGSVASLSAPSMKRADGTRVPMHPVETPISTPQTIGMAGPRANVITQGVAPGNIPVPTNTGADMRDYVNARLKNPLDE